MSKLASFTLLLSLITIYSIQTFAQDSYEKLDSSMFYNRKIVAIGEATHGSHEEQVFKNITIKKLIQKYHYNTILLEESFKAAAPLNSYIQSDSVFDIRNEMVKNYSLYWIWKTEEYIELLDWLKQYNKTAIEKITIIGIDPKVKSKVERDSLMAYNVKRTVENNEVKAILLAHNGHVANDKNYYKAFSMGAHLKKIFNNDYFIVGQLFGKGSFNIFITSTNTFDTSYVTHYANKLAKRLKENEKETILLTNNPHLKKPIDSWVYGATLYRVGNEHTQRFNPAIHFDAIIFHDNICAAKNITQNGNYLTFTVHEKKIDSIASSDTLTFKMDYFASCNSVVEIMRFQDNTYTGSSVDTLRLGTNTLTMTLPVKKAFNTIEACIYLLNDGKLTITSNSLTNRTATLICRNIFQEENNKTAPIANNRKLKLHLSYDNSWFQVVREQNRIGN